jgi:hypothetical protein
LVGSYFEFHKADRAARAMYLRVSPQVVRRAAETAKKIIPQIEVEKDFLEELGILKVPGATPP